VLLQVLDDGRLTDGQGRTVDFKNTIVIMTSNLGSPIIQEHFDRGSRRKEAHSKEAGETSEPRDLGGREDLEKEVMAELKRHFRPEFLNRVDDVIIFRSLDEAELARIVDLQLGRLEKRLGAQRLTLEVDAAAKKLLAREGYDPQFGARPLRRAIQEHLLDPLAMKLLEGGFKPGEKIKVTAGNGELVFAKK
jgi:ATP-dependent Clp protease ATP-binding subunit ClpB